MLQAAYFDPKDQDVQAVVDTLFPPDKGLTFKVIYPGANMSRYGHAEVWATHALSKMVHIPVGICTHLHTHTHTTLICNTL